MDYYIERLNQELTKIFEFWTRYAIQNEQFATQVNINGQASFTEPLGTLYLARVLFGASAYEKYSGRLLSPSLPELAYRTLRNQLSNPNGGYYWAVDEKGEIVHDPDHVSFVQAFVLYGMSEYYGLTKDPEVKQELYRQVDFIENKIKNIPDNSYLDGFDQDWNPLKEQHRSLGTHLHLLEAFSKFIEVTDDVIYKRNVEILLEMLISHFVNPEQGEVFHQFDMNWQLVPNENWIGHNLEFGWILYRAALLLKNKELTDRTKSILIALSEKAIEIGFDTHYGGMIHRFIQNKPITMDKEWWPQAEAVVAFMHAYQASHDKKFLSYAIRLLEYIDNTFSDSINGEWYEAVSRKGQPLPNHAKIHLWKSMYHNVRYCLETIKQLEALFVNVS